MKTQTISKSSTKTSLNPGKFYFKMIQGKLYWVGESFKDTGEVTFKNGESLAETP